jgi:hypothetical protein
MVNHKIRHLQQRFVTTNISIYFEVATRVHLHESLKEVPLEQTFPTKCKTRLRDIINQNPSQPGTFILQIGTLGASLALFVPRHFVPRHKDNQGDSAFIPMKVLHTASGIPRPSSVRKKAICEDRQL